MPQPVEGHNLDPRAHTAATFACGTTMGRETATADLAMLLSGRLSVAGLYLPGGVTVANFAAMSGATAMVTPTNHWMALYNENRGLVAVSDDMATAAWAANATKIFTLTDFVTPYTGFYYLGIMVQAVTVPTLRGATVNATVAAESPSFCGTANTGLTNAASAPNPFSAPSVGTSLPWLWALEPA